MDLRTRMLRPHLTLMLVIVVFGNSRLADFLPSPTLTLFSSHSAVSPGENVQFRCTFYRYTSLYCRLYNNGLLEKTQRATYLTTFTVSVYTSSQYSCDCYTSTYKSPRSNTIGITVVTLPTPGISLSTTKQVTWGERVDITCSVYTQYTGGTFSLKTGSRSVSQTKTGTSVTFSFPKVDFHHEGSYYCQYQTRFSSRDFSSPSSSSVDFTVIVTLPTPRISLSPSKEISWGERVDVTCSVDTQFREGSFILTQSSGSFTETKRGTSVTFSLLKVDFVHEGSYYCQYQTRVSSREFSSPQSSSVRFLVVVNLLQPNISFSAPDGGSHWGPQGLEVTRGYSFSIICSTQPQYPGGSFHLEFIGSNITRVTQSAVNHSATFFFSEADYVHQGNYSCVYEVTVSTRTFRSSSTELLGITVKASLAPFIGSGVGIGLLLILVPILFFFIWRCKKQKQQMDVKMVYKQRSRNTYDTAHGRNEMDEDEDDYENADFFQHKEDSDDSGEDYINFDVKEDKKARRKVDNVYSGPSTCGMSFAGNKMEEDEDEDYENVDMSEEGQVDMHADAEKCWADSEFEDEDIYANVY